MGEWNLPTEPGAARSQSNRFPLYNNKAGFFLHFVIALLYCKMDCVVARRVLSRVAMVAALLFGHRR